MQSFVLQSWGRLSMKKFLFYLNILPFYKNFELIFCDVHHPTHLNCYHIYKASHGSQVVSMSDQYVGGLPIESSILPLLKHVCVEAIGCDAGHQEVTRCCTRGEPQGMYIMYTSAKCE